MRGSLLSRVRPAAAAVLAAAGFVSLLGGCGAAPSIAPALLPAIAPKPAERAAVAPPPIVAAEEPPPPGESDDPFAYFDAATRQLIFDAEARASAAGRRVLATGREMAVVRGEVIPGSCWSYADAIYERAGFPSNARKTVWNRSKKGPYASRELFAPGDLLSYLNASWGGGPHTAIFVGWLPAALSYGGADSEALMLSYGGGERPTPAEYRAYDLSRVFRVVRPKE
jgi:hypothetical protein